MKRAKKILLDLNDLDHNDRNDREEYLVIFFCKFVG